MDELEQNGIDGDPVPTLPCVHAGELGLPPRPDEEREDGEASKRLQSYANVYKFTSIDAFKKQFFKASLKRFYGAECLPPHALASR